MGVPSRIRIAVALLIASVGAACSASGGPGAPSPAPAAQAARPAPAPNPGDVHFLSGMIHHHAQALAMSALVPERASSSSVGLLAERIRVSQTDEILLMQQWLRDQGAPVPEATPGPMRMMHDGMAHDMLMPGMLSEAQMAQLEAARGVEFDRLFLEFMIMHHEGALGMVNELFATPGAANDDFIYKMASDTYADQGSEIDRMLQMLEAMAGR